MLVKRTETKLLHRKSVSHQNNKRRVIILRADITSAILKKLAAILKPFFQRCIEILKRREIQKFEFDNGRNLLFIDRM